MFAFADDSRPCKSRLATSWSFLAAKRPTASDEVARGRLVSLDGFAFAFRAKNGEWRDSHLGFQVSFASPWLQWRNVLIRLRLNLLNVFVYLRHWRSKFVYFCAKVVSNNDFRWKLMTSGGREKNKNLFTRISLPVTVTGSELTPQLNPSMKTSTTSKNAFALEVTLTISL